MTFAEAAAAIVLSVAGHPAAVGCDAETNNPFPYPVAGWAYIGGRELHLQSKLCRDLDPKQPVPLGDRVVALGTLIHEAAHVRGVKSEECAEMYASILIYEYLERYYSIPMFSADSWWAGTVWIDRNRRMPEQYRFVHIDACDLEV